MSAWSSMGHTMLTADELMRILMDLKKAYPTTNKEPLFAIFRHSGSPHDTHDKGKVAKGHLLNALKGFHQSRQYSSGEVGGRAE